jgi:hypothetical protein
VAGSATAGDAAGPRKTLSTEPSHSGIGDILQIVEKMTDEEEWSPARRQERLLEIRDPVETMIRAARATQHDTAVPTWATQVQALTDEVVESAQQVIDNQSMDYILEKVDKKLQLMAKHASGHQEGWDRGDSGSWGSCLGQATAQPEDFCKIFDQPTTEWLANTFSDLGVGRRSRQASGPTRQPESADTLTLLAQAQALTSWSLQQVVKGLTHWTDAEIKHRSKDWSVFDGKVIHASLGRGNGRLITRRTTLACTGTP